MALLTLLKPQILGELCAVCTISQISLLALYKESNRVALHVIETVSKTVF